MRRLTIVAREWCDKYEVSFAVSKLDKTLKLFLSTVVPTKSDSDVIVFTAVK